MKIGWIGTGILGSAILKRLSSYVEIFAWNRTLSKVDLLTQFGIKKVSALKDFPNDCEILFLCVKGEETYDEVLFGEEGIAKYLKSDTLIVDLSTISPSTSIYVKNTLETYNLRYVECPVSGGPEGALIGTLTAIMAGDYEDVNKAKEIVKYFCSHMHFVGECGKGQLLKLLNNLAESINLLGAAEVVNIGINLGIDIETLYKVFSTTRGYSVYMGVLFERLLNPNQPISATLEVRIKDIKLANRIANDHNLWIPLGSLSEELFKLAQKRKGSNADQTECISIYQ